MQRFFTITEVNALIPEISAVVAEQLAAYGVIIKGLETLARLVGAPPQSLDADSADSSETAHLKAELRARVERYERGWGRIESFGGVVKDPQRGLVDFYGRVGGRTVWLCWRYGEETLGYYHDLDAGFAARQPLTDEVRRELMN